MGDDAILEGTTVFRSEDYAGQPIDIPEVPKMTLAQQKCCVVRIIELLKDMLPKAVARQKLTEEEAAQRLGEMLRVAKTLDDADNFIDIRETIDPRAYEKALRKLNEELMPRARPRVSFVKRHTKPAGPAFVPTPFDSEE